MWSKTVSNHKLKLQEKVHALFKSIEGKGNGGDFGTGGAVASAFVSRFQPRTAVLIKKSGDNSGRKSKHSP
ncbi:hypothetical protein [Paenibacillus sp. sgz500958]|uniref:hypothetical protein n=1 Tax=Paenibacillus sp. sgz500958 TaxID=3242475 RepID=UPI0036D3F932